MDNLERFIDIHSHVLPGLDDGPRDVENTMEILRLAAMNQIGDIICTPHYIDGKLRYTPDRIDELVAKLNIRIIEEGLNIKLHSGNEIFYTETALSALEGGQAKTLAASDFVLVEFAPWVRWQELIEGLFHIQSAGYHPILAHTERYECLIKGRGERERVQTLRDYGFMIQINAEAVMEKTKFTKYVLKNELADFVATDTHSTRTRGPYLKATGAYLSKKYGTGYANRLLYENARKLF